MSALHRIRQRLALGAVAALSFAGSPRILRAQVKPSEAASISQTVDGTTVRIEYSRPVARGRDTLFGGVVHWGETWTPGANWATTVETDKDIRLNGQPVAKGKYSMWMVVQRPPGEWTVFLVKDARRWHTDRPSANDGVVRFTVKPETGPYLETLTFSFPVITRSTATLRMQWGTTIVPLLVAVDPSEADTMSASARARYVGSYRVLWARGARTDTVQLEVIDSQGRLRARTSPARADADPEFDLIPAGRNRFLSGFYRNGQLVDVETDTATVFLLEGREARGIEIRAAAGGEVLARGERVK